MKIDNNNIIIPNNEVENIEGELVVYSKENKKIIVFNKTASFIWDIITKSYDNNIDITIDYICDEVMKNYNIQETETQEICNDVQEIINRFIYENIILNDKSE